MSIDQPVELCLDVPISTVLTEQEIDLNQLEVPIGDVHIDDYVNIESTVRIDGPVQTALGITVPVRADIPIRTRVHIQQPLRVVNNLKLNLNEIQIPIDANIPVRTSFQLKQTFRVRGSVEVPLHQQIEIPVRKTITASLPDDMSVAVTIAEDVRAHLDADIQADVELDHTIPARVGALVISGEHVSLQARSAPAADKRDDEGH